MCRIVGIVNFGSYADLTPAVLEMRDSMRHGGPDDAGIYVDMERGVALGHRRLSILDLSSSGHQPMSAANGRLEITYNGEAYNFLEIKQELRGMGYDFRSNTDTEVILKAYEAWGEKSFARLNGMFAFALYDRGENSLYLVRDHAGIKPLYYSISEKQMVFASEVKAFRRFDKAWAENKDWKSLFLLFGHIPEPFTTLEGVRILPKGHFLKLDLDTRCHEIRRYTETPSGETVTDFNEAVRLVRSEFVQAVKRHLISDAPIGVFLSGGIDSSLITLISSQFHENLRTLSIIFNEKQFSEEIHQRRVLQEIKATHHSYLVTEADFVNHLDPIFRAMDQPTIDGVNTYFISKCAREDGLKAVLSGLGGDELFGGYPSFRRIKMSLLLKKIHDNIPFPLKLIGYSGIDRLNKISFLGVPDLLSHYLFLRGLFSIRETSALLDLTENEVCEALQKVYLRKAGTGLSGKNLASYLETNLYMQNQLLKDSDFMSMFHSVEIRVPFLDREFMKKVSSIRESIRFPKNIPKFLLVKAFEDVLPREIVFRKKQGFTFPFDLWIRKHLRNRFEEAIRQGNIDPVYGRMLWDRFNHGKLHWSRVWGLMVMFYYRRLSEY